MTTAIIYGLVDGGYLEGGYLVELENVSIEFRHATAGTISFRKGFRYPEYSLRVMQPVEYTACGVPVWFDAVKTEVPFEATWPDMLDAELDALRTFLFTDLPLFDAVTLALVGRDMSFPVRFAERRISARHQTRGHNEVTISLIRV